MPATKTTSQKPQIEPRAHRYGFTRLLPEVCREPNPLTGSNRIVDEPSRRLALPDVRVSS